MRGFGEPGQTAAASRRLYDCVVARAREPIFYVRFSVADTIDGRFDLLALHAFLAMDALRALGPAGATLGSALASIVFAGFEDALRELGVGDLGISRRMKALASGFYGRLEAYGAANSPDALTAALIRNLYRGEATRGAEAAALAHYILTARDALPAQSDGLLEGRADFGPLPEL